MRPRAIPVLLLDCDYLWKTRTFGEARYVGDPINTVRIFNDKQADELVILDITATQNKRGPSFELISDIASEAFMPIAYGGGISTFADIERLLRVGIEKIVVNSATVASPELITKASRAFGEQAIVASMDVRGSVDGGVYTRRGRDRVATSVVEWARKLELLGVGEILLTSIDREGCRSGYDLALIQAVSRSVDVPVVANGGAGTYSDLHLAAEAGASGAAAGTCFTFYGRHNAVLITYPTDAELDEAFRVGKS